MIINMEKDILKLLEITSNDLSLKFASQDWGIINSDSKRVIEFINFYNLTKNVKNNFVKVCLVELIISSFNDFLLEKKDDKIINDKFIEFILVNKKDVIFIDLSKYWCNIKDKDNFPVGYFLC